ncbi:GNAT family N-acetyltransferase [Kalamiella sp. sgz302252]|uniref:GNAT family N-acetyltransferase n=1 Tax=Pantoea sp. sgz302252 TaxID=3341827 RepID=UPI0036D214AE
MQLTTERLLLAKLQPEDWPLFQQVHSDAVSMQYISAVPQPADVRQRFQTRLQPWQTTSLHMLCLTIKLRESGEPLGLIGANAEWSPWRQAEVGYSLLSQQTGKGYGSEALGALADWLFTECCFHKLKAQVVEGNWPSRRILEKNGFRLEGTLRENYLLRGEWVNDWLFGKLESD